ncbi:MAG TPA: hypothetical protein VF023_05880 [Bryobacteraceae bacterium]|jgi:hypothetical protein
MFDRILYTASFVFTAVQNWLEKMELHRQEKQLRRWNEFMPAPVNTRQPVKVAKIAK